MCVFKSTRSSNVSIVNIKKLFRKYLKYLFPNKIEHPNEIRINKKTKWLINLTTTRLPKNVSRVLALGDKFSAPIIDNNQIPTLELIKSLEKCTPQLDVYKKQELRLKFINHIEHFFKNNGQGATGEDLRLKLQLNRCQEYLKKHNRDLLITKSAKGKSTVIMNKQTYIKQMEIILTNNEIYKEVMKNPLSCMTNELKDLLKRWKNNEYLTNDVINSFKCYEGTIPRAYGLPQTYKKNQPMRMIVSSIGSTYHNLAQYYHGVLNLLPKSSYYLTTTYELVKKIQSLPPIDRDDILIRFNAISLFSNISIPLFLRIVDDKWSLLKNFTTLSKDEFIAGLRLILSSNYFQFNGKMYQQISGLNIGSPLSPIIRDIVMEDLEKHCINRLSFTPKFYYRCNNCLIAAIPKVRIPETIRIFNNYQEKLKFYTKTDDEIHLMDISMKKTIDNKIITNWYLGTSFTGRYINYNSHHSVDDKIKSIKNLLDRAIKLSDPSFHERNILLVKDILTTNDFPRQLINEEIDKYLTLLRENKTTVYNKIIDKKKHIVIPNVKNLSDKLVNLFKSYDFQIYLKPINTLNKYIKLGKDRLDKHCRSHVVYELSCLDCDAQYVGQTKRNVLTRMKEHFKNTQSNSSKSNVIAKHTIVYGHKFDWDNYQILDWERDPEKRLISEISHIRRKSNRINVISDNVRWTSLYDSLFK